MNIEDTLERWTVLHPFLFGLFPILFFFSQNIGQLTYGDMLVPALLALGLSVLALVTCRAAYGNWRKGAIVASVGLFLFFSYGHVWNLISKATVFGIKTRHDYLLPLWAGLFFAGAYAVYRTDWKLGGVTGFLNVASIAVIAMSLITIGSHEITTGSQEFASEQTEEEDGSALSPAVDSLPNIYYIVPDGYASSQTLSHLYGYDNSDFESFLEEKGFYVAEKSLSNYSQSALSIPSSLNMRYLEEGPDGPSPSRKIGQSVFVKRLNEAGYTFVSFNSGANISEDVSADINIDCGKWWQNEKFDSFVSTTIGMPFYSMISKGNEMGLEKRLPCTFDEISKASKKIGDPFFAFSHIIAPHPPYLFSPNGYTGKSRGNYGGSRSISNKNFYLDEIEYVNEELKNTIKKIKESERKPIIIIQSDHGTRVTRDGDIIEEDRGVNLVEDSGVERISVKDTLAKERMGILNAYHLPGCEDRLYSSISPVNSFRIVLNCYFDEQLELLPDSSYYVSYQHPYYQNVTDRAHWNDGPDQNHIVPE